MGCSMKERIIYVVNGFFIIFFLIVMTVNFYSMSTIFDEDVYFPIAAQNTNLKNELGDIQRVETSVFEFPAEEGNIRLWVYTRQQEKYFVKINIYHDYYEILEGSEI